MATIELRREHSLSFEQAKDRAENLAKEMEDKFGIKWRWDGTAIRVEAPSGPAKGAKGAVHLDEGAVRIEIDLPTLLAFFKPRVEKVLLDNLDTYLK